MMENGKRKARRQLTPEEKWEVFLEVTSQEISQAEASGKEEVRQALGGDALRRVQRTGRQARDTRAEHHRAIARAMRLGLSTREIAAAADVTHGTVRAIVNRLSITGSTSGLESEQPAEHEDRS